MNLTDHEKYLAMEALRRQFKAEARELLAIAERAGDDKQQAIDWVTADARIGKLYDQIEALGGFGD